MDLLARGSAWLEKTRRQYATQWVEYRREPSGVPVRATIGKTVFETTTSAAGAGDIIGGMLTDTEARDYLIDVADLQIEDVPIEPRDGDLIIETGPNEQRVFTVRAPKGQPAWRYSDLYEKVYRIHTKFLRKSPI